MANALKRENTMADPTPSIVPPLHLTDRDRKILKIIFDFRIPTATLLEHTSLSQGFMSTSKAVSLVAGDRKIVMLRGRFWATYPSVAIGLGRLACKNHWRDHYLL